MSHVFDLSAHAAAPAARRPSRAAVLRLALLAGGMAALALAGWAAWAGSAAAPRDADLARLLVFMAALKGGITLAAFALLAWRFGHAMPVRWAVASLLGAWLMAGGSLAIGLLVHVGGGALAFHAGALLLVAVAWRERGA